MSNSITVLGSWAIEDFGETSSFLVRAPGSSFLLDAGPGVTRQMHQISCSFTTVDFVFLTHVHADHLLGIPYLVFKRSVQQRQTAVPVNRLHVVGNVATIDAAKTLLQACYPDRSFDIEWRVVDEGDEITMNDWNVTAFNADHTVPVTGYRFEHKDASLAYLPDTCPIKTVLPFISGVSLLLIEAFGTSADFTELARNQKHLLAKDAAQIAQEAQPQKVLLYHMHLPYRDERKQEQLIEEFCQNCSLVPIVAADLLEIGF